MTLTFRQEKRLQRLADADEGHRVVGVNGDCPVVQFPDGQRLRLNASGRFDLIDSKEAA